MSLPRMLNIQAMELAWASTAASAFFSNHRALQAGDLVAGGFAGAFDRMEGDGAERRGRPVGPDAVERVFLDRHERGVCLLADLGEAADLGDGHQPRVVADAVACLEMRGEPLGRRCVGEVLGREQIRIGLGADLQRVAAVDEDRGAVGEHDRRSGRAGEAG